MNELKIRGCLWEIILPHCRFFLVVFFNKENVLVNYLYN